MKSESKSRQFHVISTNIGWKIVEKNALKARAVFDNKKDAIETANVLAKKLESELVVHREDGRIVSIRSYERVRK